MDLHFYRMGFTKVNSIYPLLCFLLLNLPYSKAEVNVCPATKSSIVRRCPTSELEYEEASRKMNCHALCGPEHRFHCIRDNKHQHLHNICARPTKIIGHCPEYNVRGQVVQNDYNSPYTYDTCADCVYINSSDVYKYPHCLHIISTENENRRNPERPHSQRVDRYGIPLPIFISVISCVCVLGVGFSILCYEKVSRKTPWKIAFRRVTRCFTCQQTEDENRDSDIRNQLCGDERNDL
ncbi:uncharacterized protein LOC125675778 [Ostrea edulis]|uniref:uncharacterized protein LOC125675778 n=1 Tax=Ostrea edulis TaxID=37623 RepID=UPI0024AF7B1D|nr:uncharacterized protein LOC125675778 [Ostrea edulis]